MTTCRHVGKLHSIDRVVWLDLHEHDPEAPAAAEARHIPEVSARHVDMYAMSLGLECDTASDAVQQRSVVIPRRHVDIQTVRDHARRVLGRSAVRPVADPFELILESTSFLPKTAVFRARPLGGLP